MGMTAFALLLAVEILLAVRTCRRKTEKRIWRRERLAGRALQTGILILHIILTAGQKWRFMPALAFLLFLLAIAALSAFLRRNRADGIKKPFSAVLSGIFGCLLLFVFMIPALVFTGYSGLPVSGPYPVGRAHAILTDSTRADPFEGDGSFREVPVHFYYPEGEGEEKYPLVVFSHGAFGYYESNTSTYMELASNGYVVAALDHPHHAFFTEDTSGSMVIVDTNFLNTALNLNSSEMDDQEEYALYRDWMDLRTADMGYAVDCIKAAAGEGAPDGAWSVSESGRAPLMSALAVTDPSRIGLMGHSMGG
ncbi:MAG: alpha/beta hydrolase family protein, partial [bacterium]